MSKKKKKNYAKNMNGPIIDLSSDFGVKYDPDVL